MLTWDLTHAAKPIPTRCPILSLPIDKKLGAHRGEPLLKPLLAYLTFEKLFVKRLQCFYRYKRV